MLVGPTSTVALLVIFMCSSGSAQEHDLSPLAPDAFGIVRPYPEARRDLDSEQDFQTCIVECLRKNAPSILNEEGCKREKRHFAYSIACQESCSKEKGICLADNGECTFKSLCAKMKSFMRRKEDMDFSLMADDDNCKETCDKLETLANVSTSLAVRTVATPCLASLGIPLTLALVTLLD